MSTCPSCSGPLSERAIFCGSCSQQARCKACHELLEAKAKACVICGVLVGEGNGVLHLQPHQTFNTFLLKETTNSRTVELNFSDTAIVNLGDVLGYVANGRLGRRKSATPAEDSGSQLLLPGTSTDSDSAVETNASVINGPPQAPSTPETSPQHHQIREVFARDGERLILDNLCLKATGQLDAGRRLVYLFLYGHELEGRQQVSRDAINEVFKDVGLYAPNISNWISTSPDLRESSEDGQSMFRLRKTGRDAARRVLAEVIDDNIPDSWQLSDRSRTRAKASSDGTSNEKASGSSGRKKSEEPNDWASKWTALQLGVDGHSIVEAASGVNRGLFGLWAIRRATNDAVKIVSVMKLAAFLYKAFVVKAAPSTLRDALESKNGKGKVLRVAGGYEITPTGITEMTALAGLGQTRAAAANKGSEKK